MGDATLLLLLLLLIIIIIIIFIIYYYHYHYIDNNHTRHNTCRKHDTRTCCAYAAKWCDDAHMDNYIHAHIRACMHSQLHLRRYS